MVNVQRPIVIAGAGVGGLTLAIALQRRGFPVRVLERTATLAPVGAGLALQPNATAVLRDLDLADAAMAAGQPVARAAILDDRGRLLGAEQDMNALTASFGAPVVAIHRGRLHAVLQNAVAPGTIQLGIEVVDYELRAETVVVHCSDGSTVDTDLLVGADGLRSRVRQRLIGDGEPFYSGYTSWRGVSEAGRGPRLVRSGESWGRGERFGMVEIGHGEIYWFAVVNAPPGGTDRDARGELLARFGDWHAPVRAVLEATSPDRILRTDISDRQPITCWHDGRVLLLGDAAHPMTPNLGQGACQAIEDAAVLADALASSETVDAACRLYESRRVSRANAIVLAARRLGSIAQWSNPVAVRLRNLMMRAQLRSLWRAPVGVHQSAAVD